MLSVSPQALLLQVFLSLADTHSQTKPIWKPTKHPPTFFFFFCEARGTRCKHYWVSVWRRLFQGKVLCSYCMTLTGYNELQGNIWGFWVTNWLADVVDLKPSDWAICLYFSQLVKPQNALIPLLTRWRAVLINYCKGDVQCDRSGVPHCGKA